MKHKTKVYIITECPYVGVFRAMLELAKVLDKMDLTVHFILPKQHRNRYGETQMENEEKLRKYGEIVHLPLQRKYRHIMSDVRQMSKFFESQIDNSVVVISITEYAGKLARILYRKRLIETLYHAPQCIDVRRKIKLHLKVAEYIFERILSQSTTKYIAAGPSEGYILHTRYGVPTDKIVLLPNFREEKAIMKVTPEYPFLYIGRIVQEKGVSDLLNAFALVNMSHMLTIIGDGPLLPDLKKKYEKVTFLGRVSEKEVYGHLVKARYFISSSIIEGLAYTLIEAMSVGVVPIVSDVEGHKDIVIDGYNGFLFSSKLELVNLIFKIGFIDSKEYQTISERSQETIKRLAMQSKKAFINEFKKYEVR